jgi:carboxylesterase type B
MIDRSTGIVVTLCMVGLLASSASGQSLADAAAKEKERRRRASESSAPPATGAKSAPSTAAAATEVHTDSWWRSHSRTSREAVADAEAQVKYYQARLDEARTDRQPGPADEPHAAPLRVLTDTEKRDAEASLAAAQKQLAAARKQMQELEEQARREQVPPEWLR